MCDYPGRASHGAIARFVVRNRDRAQRLAYQSGRDELLTACEDRGRAASEAKKVLSFKLYVKRHPSLKTLRFTLFSLRHKHGETFAGTTRFDEFAHGQFIASMAALLQCRHELRRAFGEDHVALNDDRVA